MTWIKYVTSKEFGCATTAELIAACRQDSELKKTLKEWALQEMRSKNIPIDEE